ncbi:glycoside hydrolase family 65 protein [Puteibacter caeruleilacunae]|nr:glycoside hydrolase family 65 protein [Puteibacter caeruleilacunae]
MKTLLKYLILLLAIESFGQKGDGWNISIQKDERYSGVVLANGRLGILSSERLFEINHVILNNVFEQGLTSSAPGSASKVSRILKGMNFGNLEMYIDDEKITKENISSWQQTLNMKEASLTTSFMFRHKAKISYTIYALRNVPYSAYIDFNIQANRALTVRVIGKIEGSSSFKNPISTFRTLWDKETTIPVMQTVATTDKGAHTIATSASFVWHDINSTREHLRPQLKYEKVSKNLNQIWFDKEVKKGGNLTFAWTASECSSQDFNDPASESERFVINNLVTPKATLLNGHKQLWEELWEGDIVIEGDMQSQRDVRLALYHLYSFGRAGSDLSIAPMGLSSQNYNGHIFWDAELWIYPPLLMLNQDIAESLVNYRFQRLEPAQKKADNFGFKGAMFPWESDDSGEEATPTWALTGTLEHHITSDVAIAFWNYYRVTKDLEWLKEKGFPVIKDIADFWVSRAKKNCDGSYSIINVIGANENAVNVDDNAFTNGAAITALKYAIKAAKEVNCVVDPKWDAVANRIKIHHFNDGTTKEHSTYNGAIIKQADVNLLAYPLNIVSDTSTILRDLIYYEPKLEHGGPAMGKAILSVLYSRLGDVDNAYRLFKDCYEPYKCGPFGALAENIGSRKTYFATGAGGMLQTVLFGFAGLHLTDDGIIQKSPALPRDWKSLTIKGVGPEKKSYVIEQE